MGLNKRWFQGVMVVAVMSVMIANGPVRAEEPAKTAVVDLQYALNNTQEGKSSKAALQGEKEQKEQQLTLLENTLKKMQEDIQKQRLVLSEEALQQKMEEFKRKYGELQQKALEFEKELRRKEEESAERILAGLQKVVGQLAQSKGYTLVLERSRGGVVYADSSIPDITSAVVEGYNKNPPKAVKK